MIESVGSVDYGELGFIARFDYEPATVAIVRKIQRRRWLSEHRAWLVEPHWPSLRVLLRLANQHNWAITHQALVAARKVREEGEAYEYSVDVVQGGCGEPWFRCLVGDDDTLPKQLGQLPQAFTEPDDASWWVPAFRADCCEPLAEIVDNDERFEISKGARRLLDEPDESYAHLVEAADTQAAATAALDISSVAEPSPGSVEPIPPAADE